MVQSRQETNTTWGPSDSSHKIKKLLCQNFIGILAGHYQMNLSSFLSYGKSSPALVSDFVEAA